MNWTLVSRSLPPEGQPVLTIAPHGSEQVLVRKGNLWFHADMSMYVYYTPTHWRAV
jgi:hypothetical protein